MIATLTEQRHAPANEWEWPWYSLHDEDGRQIATVHRVYAGGDYWWATDGEYFMEFEEAVDHWERKAP